MKISYAITACNEHIELEKLLRFLKRNIREEDEVIIQLDSINTTNEVQEVCNLFTGFNHKTELVDSITNSKSYQFPLNNDFATFKNELFKQATGDYMFSIDADEIPHIDLIKSLPLILEQNSEIDVFFVPRVNTVDGIGLSHIKHKWGWNVSKLKSIVGEKEFDLDNPQDLDEYNLLKEYNLIINEEIKVMNKIKIKYHKPIINWCDYQMRIYKNKPEIRWIKPVHEILDGFKTFSHLPAEEVWSLYHPKDIKRQEKQNQYYDTFS
jgi:hypothetical protein